MLISRTRDNSNFASYKTLRIAKESAWHNIDHMSLLCVKEIFSIDIGAAPEGTIQVQLNRHKPPYQVITENHV